jgi:HD-like signal output (HDOD) protein
MKSKELIQRICAMRVFKAARLGLYGIRQNIDTITRAIAIMGLKSVKIITLFKNTYVSEKINYL